MKNIILFMLALCLGFSAAGQAKPKMPDKGFINAFKNFEDGSPEIRYGEVTVEMNWDVMILKVFQDGKLKEESTNLKVDREANGIIILNDAKKDQHWDKIVVLKSVDGIYTSVFIRKTDSWEIKISEIKY